MISFRPVHCGVVLVGALAFPRVSLVQTLTVDAGLQLWLRGDAGVTTGANGGVVQRDDQSGNANYAVQLAGALKFYDTIAFAVVPLARLPPA